MSWNTAVRPQGPLNPYIFWKPMMSVIQIWIKIQTQRQIQRQRLRQIQTQIQRQRQIKEEPETPMLWYVFEQEMKKGFWIRYATGRVSENINTETNTKTNTKTNARTIDRPVMLYVFGNRITKGVWLWRMYRWFRICRIYKIFPSPFFVSTNKYFPSPNIFLLFLLHSSSHKSKCHEVQSPMSPFNLADPCLAQ